MKKNKIMAKNWIKIKYKNIKGLFIKLGRILAKGKDYCPYCHSDNK